DDRVALTERVEQADHVADQVEDRVRIDALGAVGLAVAALVGRDGAIAGGGERAQLMAPGAGELREAAQQEHESTAAFLERGHAKAVGLDEARHAATMPRRASALGSPRAQLAERQRPDSRAIARQRCRPPYARCTCDGAYARVWTGERSRSVWSDSCN